jgi:hypothetical protein
MRAYTSYQKKKEKGSRNKMRTAKQRTLPPHSPCSTTTTTTTTTFFLLQQLQLLLLLLIPILLQVCEERFTRNTKEPVPTGVGFHVAKSLQLQEEVSQNGGHVHTGSFLADHQSRRESQYGAKHLGHHSLEGEVA